MSTGFRIDHTDSYTQDLESGDDGNYSVDITYKENGAKNDYDSIDSKGSDIQLSHPVEDVEELDHTKHLTAQLQRIRADKYAHSFASGSEVTVFDRALLRLLETTFEVEELPIEESPIPVERLKALYLKEAYCFDSHKDLIQHLNENEETVRQLGFESISNIPSNTTFWRAERTIDKRDLTDPLSNAVKRAVFAVYRNGLPVPQRILDNFNLEQLPTSIDERRVSRSTEKQALRNWISLLIEETLEPLTFHRAENKSHHYAAFLGLFAHSALQNIGLQRGIDTADWLYPRGTIPAGSGVSIHINKLDISEINQQFNQVHNNFFAFTKSLGFLNNPVNIAYDGLAIEWSGVDTRWTISRPAKSENDVREEWHYGILAIIDNEQRFTLGVRHVNKKNKYAPKLDELLKNTTALIDVERLYADRGFHDGNIITVLRKHLGKRWVIHARNEHDIKELVRTTLADDIGFRRGVKGGGVKPKPNAFAYPFGGHQPPLFHYNKDTAHGVGSKFSHKPYLTDLTPNDTSGSGIHFTYNNRWSVETTANELVNNFYPYTASGESKIRLYHLNIAQLIHNWHVLINRCPSPKYGLRLDVAHQQTLTAIRDVAFGILNAE